MLFQNEKTQFWACEKLEINSRHIELSVFDTLFYLQLFTNLSNNCSTKTEWDVPLFDFVIWRKCSAYQKNYSVCLARSKTRRLILLSYSMLTIPEADGNVISSSGIWLKTNILDIFKFWHYDGARRKQMSKFIQRETLITMPIISLQSSQSLSRYFTAFEFDYFSYVVVLNSLWMQRISAITKIVNNF